MPRNYDIAELRRLDIAHHLPAQADWQEIEDLGGSRIITHADGCYIHDGDGNRILDGMAGLWCVNVGYGRAELADVAIVTDDNPRTEVPGAIRAEVMAGVAGLKEIGDRREAIRTAAGLLADGDILVVAGKGHEQGQTIGDVIHPFDDVAETARALELVHG